MLNEIGLSNLFLTTSPLVIWPRKMFRRLKVLHIAVCSTGSGWDLGIVGALGSFLADTQKCPLQCWFSNINVVGTFWVRVSIYCTDCNISLLLQKICNFISLESVPHATLRKHFRYRFCKLARIPLVLHLLLLQHPAPSVWTMQLWNGRGTDTPSVHTDIVQIIRDQSVVLSRSRRA